MLGQKISYTLFQLNLHNCVEQNYEPCFINKKIDMQTCKNPRASKQFKLNIAPDFSNSIVMTDIQQMRLNKVK